MKFGKIYILFITIFLTFYIPFSYAEINCSPGVRDVPGTLSQNGGFYFHNKRGWGTPTRQLYLTMNPAHIVFTRFRDNYNMISHYYEPAPNTSHTDAYCFVVNTGEVNNVEADVDIKYDFTKPLIPGGKTSDGYQIFHLNEETKNYLGIILEISAIGGEGSSWQKVTSTNGKVRGFHWRNARTTPIWPTIRARYILTGTPNKNVDINPAADINIGKMYMTSDPYPGSSYIGGDVRVDDSVGTNVHFKHEKITIREIVKSCNVEGGKERNVNLKSVYKRELGTRPLTKVKGGEFDLIVSCNPVFDEHEGFKRHPKIYVTFGDLYNNTNNSNQISIKQGDGYAEKAALQIYPSNGTQVINLGPDNSSLGNPGQIKLVDVDPVTGKSINKFDVYYINLAVTDWFFTGEGKVKEGKVKAAVTYTFSYQ